MTKPLCHRHTKKRIQVNNFKITKVRERQITTWVKITACPKFLQNTRNPGEAMGGKGHKDVCLCYGTDTWGSWDTETKNVMNSVLLKSSN